MSVNFKNIRAWKDGNKNVYGVYDKTAGNWLWQKYFKITYDDEGGGGETYYTYFLVYYATGSNHPLPALGGIYNTNPSDANHKPILIKHVNEVFGNDLYRNGYQYYNDRWIDKRNNIQYTANKEIVLSQSLQLHVIWYRIINISFDACAPVDPLPTLSVELHQTYSTAKDTQEHKFPDTVNWHNHIFKYWTTTYENELCIIYPYTEVTIDNDHTLSAVWEKNLLTEDNYNLAMAHSSKTLISIYDYDESKKLTKLNDGPKDFNDSLAENCVIWIKRGTADYRSTIKTLAQYIINRFKNEHDIT